MKNTAPPILLLLALLPAGCAAFAPEADLGIVLPAPPEHWQRAFSNLEARIVFPDATGRIREVDVSDWDAPGGISCPKTGTTPVLAWPRTCGSGEQGQGGHGRLRPAGALYPFSLRGDGRTLELTWAEGAAGYVLMLLRSGETDCSRFNAQRLSTYIRGHADPWDLDLEGIAQKIAGGDFTAFDIDSLPCRDQVVKPGPGEWFLESPFRDVLAADELGEVTLCGLSDGVHALFSIDGKELRIASSSLGVLVSPIP
ncbi:MAG: hypothetical protein ABSG63_07765 [Spirochaetia bacterium]